MGESPPNSPGGQSQAPQGKGPAGVSGAGGPSGHPPPCALPNAVSVPLTAKWAAASESVPSSNSQSRPPTSASSHLWDLVAFLGVGSGGGSPQVRPFPFYLPLPRPLGLVLKDSSPLPLPHTGQGQGGLKQHNSMEGKALLCSLSLSFFKSRAQARWVGAPYWLAPGRGFLG